MAKIPDEDKAAVYNGWNGSGTPYELADNRVVLHGGGNFCECDGGQPPDTLIDQDVVDAAQALAQKYGKRITGQYGEWWGYSEYTPDPGDVSIFDWVDI